MTDKERVISSVSQVKMVKWPPPIITEFYPVKPAYFIVHIISILLLSLVLPPATVGIIPMVFTICSYHQFLEIIKVKHCLIE